MPMKIANNLDVFCLLIMASKSFHEPKCSNFNVYVWRKILTNEVVFRKTNIIYIFVAPFGGFSNDQDFNFLYTDVQRDDWIKESHLCLLADDEFEQSSTPSVSNNN